jgi:hypothetical protein
VAPSSLVTKLNFFLHLSLTQVFDKLERLSLISLPCLVKYIRIISLSLPVCLTEFLLIIKEYFDIKIEQMALLTNVVAPKSQ